MPGGDDDSTRAMTLADLVEAHAPTLIPVAAGWGRRADDQVAQALVAVWRQGPPYAAAVDHVRRELAVGPGDTRRPGPTTPSTPAAPTTPSTPTSSSAALDADPARVASIHRLAQRHRVDDRRRGRRLGAVVAATAVAVAAVVLAVALVLPRLSGPAAEAVPSPSTTPISTPSSAPTTPRPVPTTASSPAPTTVSTPTRTATPRRTGDPELTCNSQYCLPENADVWSTQVVATAYDRLDRGSAFSRGGIVAATSLSSNRTGDLLAVTVTAADTGSTVDVWTATDPTQLPACGAEVGTTCRSMSTSQGPVEIAWTDNVVEARAGSGDSTVQIVLRNAGQPLGIGVDAAIDFLLDQRLQLPD